jgi:uncharacterized membrane protein
MYVDYLKFLIIYVIIDLVWILGARKLHNQTVEKVQGSPLKADPIPIALYYLMAPLAYIFIIKPHAKNMSDVIKMAALVGALMFGTFDLTNKAIFKNYTWSYAIMDIMWGIFSITLVSVLCWKYLGTF